MKKILLLIFFNVCCFAAFSQHENDWINYSQEYYKIKVWNNGINRISQQTLAFAGFSTFGIDPRKIQIYRNGVEQHIYIQGENDGVFDSNDFIEFYGEKNDGSFDNKLYDSTWWQPTPHYSLFTDTAVYFLTYSPTTNGKRVAILNDVNFNSYTPADYFIKESFVDGRDVPNASLLFGYNRGMDGEFINYTESEGWGSVFGNYSGGNYPISVPVQTDKVNTNGPNAEISLCIGGVNNPPHNLTVTFPGINHSDIYFNQALRNYTFSVSPAAFSSSVSQCVMNVSSPPSDPDYSMFYWMSVKYPHLYDFTGSNMFSFFVPNDPSQTKTRMDIVNFNAGGNPPILYDLTNHRRIEVVFNGSIFQALVDDDNSSTAKECFLSSTAAINLPPVTKINYNTSNIGYFNNLGALNIDSAYIIITNRSLWSEAQSYKNYRNTHAPNINRTIVVDIEELYDQFAYGIQKHPLSVKNFSRYILDTWTTEAQHIFIIGKSISAADFRHDPTLYSKCLVASLGVPPSDILLTSGINGAKWEPRIPIGRLSAVDGFDVNSYLHKVMEYEDAQSGDPQPWMKEILHFGGGNDIIQQAELAGYLAQYENIMEDSMYGGHVTTYLKFNNDPIQSNLSDTLQAQINDGVSIMTFFGHASGSGFDISTDEPSNYGNHGKYPMVIANSCFAGDFHTNQRSVSEKFVLEPEKAAIGFLASVGLGNPFYLFRYTTKFFEQASYYDYGGTVGQLMQKTIQEIQGLNSVGDKQVSSEMSLQGDPAIRLNSFGKPDYQIDESGIRFIPSTISTDLDTFSVAIDIRNLGKAVQDSFIVRITHTYSNGIDSVYEVKKGRCYYSEEFIVQLNTGGFSGAGVNKLKVEIDLPDSVDEYQNYLNNTANVDFFIFSRDIIPVYPPDYAIHPNNTVTLKASTANPLAGMASYKFEIDTIDLNLKDATSGMQTSPLYRFTTVTDSGGVLEWAPSNYTLLDSVVYYWRVANDSIQFDTTNFHWQQSSFMYIPGKTGWAQSHFHQFKSDNYENVRYDTLGRKFEFVDNLKSLRVITMGAPTTFNQFNEIGYYMNNSPIEYNGCQVNAGVMVAVLDSISLQPWTNCEYNFGQVNTWTLNSGEECPNGEGAGSCRARPENYFIFRFADPFHPGQMDSLQNMINSVPSGNYILLYSWFTDDYSNIPGFPNIISSLGFASQPNDNAPFIYFVRKGFAGTHLETFGSQQGDTISLTSLLQSKWNRGNINSVLIGPASNWESLHWNQRPWETQLLQDVVHVNVLGLNAVTNNWDTLAAGIQYATGKDTSLSWISATSYPYIKLQSYLQDDSLRTPPQMTYWRIYYDDVPECAVNPNRSFSFYSNPMQEGDTLRLAIAIENISNLPMDSLGVSFYLYDNNRVKKNYPKVLLDSLRVNDYLIASFVIDSTFGLAGENSLWVEANPFNVDGWNKYQPEKYHFNNFAEIKFAMDRDRINPILDVTFDGVHILNGDIVSGKPNITMQLHDENRYLELNDSSKFTVYLTTPGANTPIMIDWNNTTFGQAMKFTPANLPNNSCRIDWNPTFNEDGIYTLSVEARDISNNESGKYNYRISFEVINRSTITEVLNYPNPFSTSTRFVFTLTGNEIPTGMKIQIMTVTGKIVREILQNELGNIHVGRNITDYAWDGKDEYGDRLANGLYLYRVVTDLHGQSIEHRETEIDKYFKKGWGKMYLMR